MGNAWKCNQCNAAMHKFLLKVEVLAFMPCVGLCMQEATDAHHAALERVQETALVISVFVGRGLSRWELIYVDTK